jgi:hypothetical protein
MLFVSSCRGARSPEHPAGIEPARPTWEAGRLPLHHGCLSRLDTLTKRTGPGVFFVTPGPDCFRERNRHHWFGGRAGRLIQHRSAKRLLSLRHEIRLRSKTTIVSSRVDRFVEGRVVGLSSCGTLVRRRERAWVRGDSHFFSQGNGIVRFAPGKQTVFPFTTR